MGPILLLALLVLIEAAPEPCDLEVGPDGCVVGARHGRFVVNPHDTFIGRSLRHYGEWEEASLRLLEAFVREGDLVVDVGANVGAFVVPLSKLVGSDGAVLAYEPQPRVFQQLATNLLLNDVDNVRALQSAVGSEDSSIRVPRVNPLQDANFGGLSLLDETYAQSSFLHDRVPLVRLDDENLFRRKCPSVLKVDVEGMEMHVLHGASSVLERCKPVLLLECNCMRTSPMVLGRLLSLNYDVFWSVHPVYQRDNFRRRVDNIFGPLLSINVVALPRGKQIPTRAGNFSDVLADALSRDKLVNAGYWYLHEYNFTVMVHVDDPESVSDSRRILVQYGNGTWCP